MKHRVLVVEDNPLNCELLCDWLEVEDYEVQSVRDLNSAFAAVTNFRPDIVLLDVQLGTDNGLSLASWMEQQSDFCQIPVIAVTAQAMIQEREHILKSGCDSIVSKPIDFKVLQEQLQRWLSRANALQE